MNESSVDRILTFRLPTYNEIPDVGLFLEQTAKYINTYLEPLGNVNITTSMISNYVKKDIIENPVKKQYYRDQIAKIIFIAIAKTVLSLEDIQVMLKLLPDICDVKMAYKFFCNRFEQTVYKVFEISDMLESDAADNSDSDEKKLLCNTITAVAHKIYLDSAFNDIRVKQEKDE